MAEHENDEPILQRDTVRLAQMRRISLFLDVLLIGGCAFLIISDVLNVLNATPPFESRGGAYLVNLSASFALINRSMALAQRFGHAAATRKSVIVVKWLLMVIVPIVFASLVEREVQRGHRVQLEALVSAIAARTASAVNTHDEVRAADLMDLRGPYLRELTVRADTGSFVLAALVPALDSEGYAARYSSTEGVWHLDPYASPTQSSPSFDRNGPLLNCALGADALECTAGAQ